MSESRTSNTSNKWLDLKWAARSVYSLLCQARRERDVATEAVLFSQATQELKDALAEHGGRSLREKPEEDLVLEVTIDALECYERASRLRASEAADNFLGATQAHCEWQASCAAAISKRLREGGTMSGPTTLDGNPISDSPHSRLAASWSCDAVAEAGGRDVSG